LYTPPVVVSDDGAIQVIGPASVSLAGKFTDISSIEEAKVVTR
jgi:hypothetical protein